MLYSYLGIFIFISKVHLAKLFFISNPFAESRKQII